MKGAWGGLQRVEIGDEVAAHPVHVDEALDVGLLHQPLVLAVDGVDVGLPPDGVIGHVHGGEDALVEAVPAGEALGHVRPGTCPTRPLG